MKLISWYVKFSLTVADLPSFSTRCAADESFSSRFKTHVFYIPKNWLKLSLPVTECNLDKHKLVGFFFRKLMVFFMLTVLSLSTCKYQLYGGEVMAKASTMKINISVSFVFAKTGLLLFEQCSAILVSASS